MRRGNSAGVGIMGREETTVMSRPKLEPSPAHPISIEPTDGRVIVSVGGHVVADTTAAVTLREAGYAPVQYIPFADLDQSVLRRSETVTYCPYKGDASYLSVDLGENVRVDDVIWRYEEPFPAVAEIAGRVAFYADRAEVRVGADAPPRAR